MTNLEWKKWEICLKYKIDEIISVIHNHRVWQNKWSPNEISHLAFELNLRWSAWYKERSHWFKPIHFIVCTLNTKRKAERMASEINISSKEMTTVRKQRESNEWNKSAIKKYVPCTAPHRTTPRQATQKQTNYFCLTIPPTLALTSTFGSLWASYSLCVTCANMHVSLSRNSIGGIGTRIETWQMNSKFMKSQSKFLCIATYIHTHSHKQRTHIVPIPTLPRDEMCLLTVFHYIRRNSNLPHLTPAASIRRKKKLLVLD